MWPLIRLFWLIEHMVTSAPRLDCFAPMKSSSVIFSKLNWTQFFSSFSDSTFRGSGGSSSSSGSTSGLGSSSMSSTPGKSGPSSSPAKSDSRQHDDSEESGVGHEEEEEIQQLLIELLSNIKTPKVSWKSCSRIDLNLLLYWLVLTRIVSKLFLSVANDRRT